MSCLALAVTMVYRDLETIRFRRKPKSIDGDIGQPFDLPLVTTSPLMRKPGRVVSVQVLHFYGEPKRQFTKKNDSNILISETEVRKFKLCSLVNAEKE